MTTRNLMTLPNFDENDPKLVNVIVEAPCSNRIKFKYDPKTDVFGVSYVLPKFAAFPCDLVSSLRRSPRTATRTSWFSWTRLASSDALCSHVSSE